jgi:hypothetical protein
MAESDVGVWDGQFGLEHIESVLLLVYLSALPFILRLRPSGTLYLSSLTCTLFTYLLPFNFTFAPLYGAHYPSFLSHPLPFVFAFALLYTLSIHLLLLYPPPPRLIS